MADRKIHTTTFGEIQTESDGNLRCYYPNKCHVCHCLDKKIKPLKRCSRCQLMAYCGKLHQKLDWKDHKDFCKVISELGGAKLFQGLKHLQDPLNASTQIKYNLVIKRVQEKKMAFYNTTSRITRTPFLFEMQMMLYPRICAVCFECDPQLLSSCENCPQVSFCNEHKDDLSHSKICNLFKLACEIELAHPEAKICFQIEAKKLRTVTFPFQKESTPLPGSMKDFLVTDSCIAVKRNSKHIKNLSSILCEIYLADAISPILTILYAMEKLKFPVTSDLEIHVIGASTDEVMEPIWELLLHWLPAVNNLNLVFVGPELKKSGNICTVELCNTCTRKNVNLNIYASAELYQNYTENSRFKKPNIVIAFNAGVHAFFTWVPAIEKVVDLRCPFVQTSYTELEAHQDQQCILQTLPKVNPFFFGPNPFASYYCERNADDEKVFTRNEILTIYDFV